MNEDISADVRQEKSRRGLLALVGAGGAAALAALLSRSNGAYADHGVLNATSSDGSPAIHGNNTDGGPGVEGTSGNGPGVEGHSNSAPGVVGQSGSGPGVKGESQSGDAVIGHSLSASGVYGFSGEAEEDILTLHGFGASGVQGVNVGEEGFGVSGLGPTGVVGEGRDAGVLGLVSSSPADDVEGNAEQAGVRGEAVGCTRKGPCEPGIGIGVHGRSEAGIGVRGDSQSGPAFEGFSESGAGAFVSSLSGPGVDATSESGPGVLGWSPEGVGVMGIGSIVRGLGVVPEVAPGVLGIAPGNAAAIQCVSGGLVGGDGPPAPDPDGGLALDVVGKARFSTAGADTLLRNQNAAFVANPAVTADSHISVTLAGNPGNRYLQWVERNPGAGFTVHLAQVSSGPRPPTAFTYLIVEPA